MSCQYDSKIQFANWIFPLFYLNLSVEKNMNSIEMMMSFVQHRDTQIIIGRCVWWHWYCKFHRIRNWAQVTVKNRHRKPDKAWLHCVIHDETNENVIISVFIFVLRRTIWRRWWWIIIFFVLEHNGGSHQRTSMTHPIEGI